GQRGERGGDLVQGQAHVAGRPDERQSPQHVAFVAPLVSRRPRRPDESRVFVKAQRGRGEAAAGGDIAHGQMVSGPHGSSSSLDLKLTSTTTIGRMNSTSQPTA